MIKEGQNTPSVTPNEAEPEEIDKEELASAKDLVQALLKATKAQKLYLPNNPIRQKFVTDLNDKFRVHLGSYGTFSFKVRQYEILFGTHSVYENTNRLESVAFRMYVDGIREISFHEGLEPREVDSFFEILSREYDASSPDDDMVTLLWEKNFSHITYVIASEFLGENEVSPDMIRTDEETNSTEKGIQEALRDAKAVTASIRGDLESNPLLNQDRPDLQIFRISDEEVRRIQKEMELEENYHFVSELMDILFAIIYIEEDIESFSQIVDILDDVLEVLVVNGEFQQATKILRLYRELSDPKRGLSPMHIQKISAGIDKAASEGRLLNLEEHLENKGLQTAEHLYAFLALLNRNAVIPLTNLLGSFKHMEIRRVLCEALAELAKNDIDLLGSRLADSRWFIVRNIALILGRIGGPSVIGHLEKVVAHPEVKVRREVFRALSGIAHERALAQLMRFIHDSDQSLRVDATRLVAAGHYAPAEHVLLDVIGQAEFEERDLMEKKEVFEALGRIGGDRVMPVFRKYIRRRAWFWQKKSRRDEMGICAALVLKGFNTPEAFSVLEEGKRARSRIIRDTCRKIVEELGREKDGVASGAGS